MSKYNPRRLDSKTVHKIEASLQADYAKRKRLSGEIPPSDPDDFRAKPSKEQIEKFDIVCLFCFHSWDIGDADLPVFCPNCGEKIDVLKIAD